MKAERKREVPPSKHYLRETKPGLRPSAVQGWLASIFRDPPGRQREDVQPRGLTSLIRDGLTSASSCVLLSCFCYPFSFCFNSPSCIGYLGPDTPSMPPSHLYLLLNSES